MRDYLCSNQFKEEFVALKKSDQLRFSEPIGWQNKIITNSPLINNFGSIWAELKETYLKELPDLSYKNIPSAKGVADNFYKIVSILSSLNLED